MDDNQDLFIEMQTPEDQESLFSYNLPMIYQETMHRMKKQISQDDEIIDEQLLKKTSQLHQSLRNKKLLQFQLLQAQIMKKENLEQSEILEEEINLMEVNQKQIIQANHEAKIQFFTLQQQIEYQRKVNKQLTQRIDQRNIKIVKNRQILDKKEKQSHLRELPKGSQKVKQHGYISIEKIRLQAENQSKKDIIYQMKKMICELKDNISKKQAQHMELEPQYQSLLKDLKKEKEAKNKDKKNRSSANKVASTFRYNSQIGQTGRSEFDKENQMNPINQLAPSHNKSLETLKTKQQPKKSKANTNSQFVLDKNKDVDSCLKKWLQTGKRSIPKRLY